MSATCEHTDAEAWRHPECAGCAGLVERRAASGAQAVLEPRPQVQRDIYAGAERLARSMAEPIDAAALDALARSVPREQMWIEIDAGSGDRNERRLMAGASGQATPPAQRQTLARVWLERGSDLVQVRSWSAAPHPDCPSLFPDRPLTPEERAAHDEDPRPGVWAGESGADLRALTQDETDILIRGELWHNAPLGEHLQLKGMIGELREVFVAAGKAKQMRIYTQRGGIDSDPLVRLLAYRAWGDRDRSDDARIAEAENRLSWLFKSLQDYPTVSAWCGPSFEYDLAYHDLLDVRGLDPPRATRLRRRALVAMLMACLNALEEHYSMGLATDRARCLACLNALAPSDADEARLVSIARAAFEAVARREALDNIDMFSIDRDARWVHARFVKDALDELDASTDDPPD